MTQPTQSEINEARHAITFAMEAAELCGQDHCTLMHRDLDIILAATNQHEKLDNDMRIKFLKEMGFNYECTRNEDGTLREHILGHDAFKGLFINHTSLMCAAQHALRGLHVLGRATTQQTCVTVDELMADNTITYHMHDAIILSNLAKKYPNGLKIIPNKQGDGE